jgi:hypothetical protein
LVIDGGRSGGVGRRATVDDDDDNDGFFGSNAIALNRCVVIAATQGYQMPDI